MGVSSLAVSRRSARPDPLMANLLYPKIVTSGNNVFVAWQDKVLGGNEIFFRASNDGGNKFTGIKNLSRNNTGDSISPVLA